MPSPAEAVVAVATTPESDRTKSAAAANTSPSPSAVVAAAAEAATMILGNNNNINHNCVVASSSGSDENRNQRNESVNNNNSVIHLSESDIKMLVLALNEERHRDHALHILSNIASFRPLRAYDLAPVLWDTPGIVFILLKEVMTAYLILDKESSLRIKVPRVVDAICLLQSIAMHSGLRKSFVKAQIPAYVYPFLRLRETSQSIEKLRTASLGLVGALVKAYDSEVVHYLLDSEVFPCCLCSLEFGNQFAKTVVAFIIFKLLSSKEGIRYCYSVPERFLSVLQVFLKIVEQTQLNDSTVKMFRFVVGSYTAFAEVPRACGYIRSYFPPKFSNVHVLMQFSKVEPKLYGDLMRLRTRIDEESIHLGLPSIGFGFDPQ